MDKWLKCKKCSLYKNRHNVVLGQGELPCDLLLIDESPTKVEDVLGEAYIGSHGNMMEVMLKHAADMVGVEVPKVYQTFICACRSVDLQIGFDCEPTEKQAWACFGRLMEVVKKAKPMRVILLGKFAHKYGAKAFPAAIKMHEPSFIVRSGGLRSPYYPKQIRNLSIILKEIADEKEKASKSKNKSKRHLRLA